VTLESKVDIALRLAQQAHQEDLSEVQAQVLAAMSDDPKGPRTITLVDDDGKEVKATAYPGNRRWDAVEIEAYPANGRYSDEEDEVG
jgi:hypothetical protein